MCSRPSGPSVTVSFHRFTATHRTAGCTSPPCWSTSHQRNGIAAGTPIPSRFLFTHSFIPHNPNTSHSHAHIRLRAKTVGLVEVRSSVSSSHRAELRSVQCVDHWCGRLEARGSHRCRSLQHIRPSSITHVRIHSYPFVSRSIGIKSIIVKSSCRVVRKLVRVATW